MAIDPLYARYPFFSAARAAVDEAGVSLEGLAAEEAPAVERGRERVERALVEGTVASGTPGRWSTRAELLSYPIARVLVSLLEVDGAVEKYAAAEAATASDRFEADLGAPTDLRTLDADLSRDRLLAEFDLGAAVRDAEARDRWWVALGPYLRLSDPDWGNDWRLAVRVVADGEIRVTDEDLGRILEEAVRRRVVEGLPFDVRASPGGEAVADALAAPVAALRERLSDHQPVRSVDVAVPDPVSFPPCVAALVERARDGESLPPHSWFLLAAFCSSAGMDPAAVASLVGAEGEDAEAIEYRMGYLSADEGTQYPPPTCATVQAYGDCVDRDERCETVASPLAYYASAVTDGGAAGAGTDATDEDTTD
jgi:DNA primase large subunit